MPSLLHAQGPAIAETTEFRCIGTGLELGNYIASRVYPSIGDFDQAVLGMIYLLQQVKKHVAFCGGKSCIWTMGENGEMERVRGTFEADVTTFIGHYEQLVCEAMMILANPASTGEDMSLAQRYLNDILAEYRAEMMASVNHGQKILERLKARKPARTHV